MAHARSPRPGPSPESLGFGLEFTNLGFVPQLLVWTLRQWWGDAGRTTGSLQLIRRAFAQLNIADLVGALDELLLALRAGSDRPLGIACVRWRRLTADEARFLALIEAFQRGDDQRGGDLLGQWLPPAAVRAVLPTAEHVSIDMGLRGLNLADRIAIPRSAVRPAQETLSPSARPH